MRLLIALFLALTLGAGELSANEHVERLAQALHLDDVIEILGQEGAVQGSDLDHALLDGQGGVFFQDQVRGLYDPDWMKDQIRQALVGHMTESQMTQAAIFFESDLGQTIISLENSARRAFADDGVEEIANSTYRQADRSSDRFRLIREYVQVNDLIEQNMQNALSSDYNFFRGVAEGQGTARDDTTILAELLAQQDDTRVETEKWVYSFLLLAYQPLTQSQMRGNIAFSRTDAGQALNLAIFKGFDEMYDVISYQLGQAVAQALGASDL